MHIHDETMLDRDRLYVDTPALELVGRMHTGTWYSLQTNLLVMRRITETEHRSRTIKRT